MPLSLSEESALIDAVRTVARTEIVPRFLRLSDDAVVAKSNAADLVTIADQRAEEVLSDALATILPGVLVVGEEASEEDPHLPEKIAQADRAVIIDPVDGTWNFAAGLCTFGVIVAVTEQGQTVFGVLYDPIMDDWVLARRGGGCWYVRPGETPRRCQVAPDAPEATGYVTMSLLPEAERPAIAARLHAVGRHDTLHCACHEYRMLVLGKSRFVVGYVPKAWDHAAGHLAVLEAGGVASQMDGAPYHPGVSRTPLLAAASASHFTAVVAAMTGDPS